MALVASIVVERGNRAAARTIASVYGPPAQTTALPGGLNTQPLEHVFHRYLLNDQKSQENYPHSMSKNSILHLHVTLDNSDNNLSFILCM